MKNTKISKQGYLTIILVVVLFIIGVYFFAGERYRVNDMDASGAYVCMVSMLCCLIVFSNKEIALSRKLLIGVGIANVLLLLFLWIEKDFSLTYEGRHVFIMMLVMAFIYSGFYLWIKKKERSLKQQEIEKD